MKDEENTFRGTVCVPSVHRLSVHMLTRQISNYSFLFLFSSIFSKNALKWFLLSSTYEILFIYLLDFFW